MTHSKESLNKGQRKKGKVFPARPYFFLSCLLEKWGFFTFLFLLFLQNFLSVLCTGLPGGCVCCRGWHLQVAAELDVKELPFCVYVRLPFWDALGTE